MAQRIYISPSLQPANLYVDGSGSEQDHMHAVGGRVVELLKQHQEFVVFSNHVGMTMQQAVEESNNLAVHAHVAIHSNAGGGAGTLALYYPGSVQGEKLAKAVYDQVAPLSPGADDGARADNRGLYELRHTKAPAVIIEVEFHDSANLAAWIGSHEQELAQAIYKGICTYFEVAPVRTQAEAKQINVHAGDKVYTGELRDNKTMVHVRVLEEFGLKVDWDGKEVWVSESQKAVSLDLPSYSHMPKCDVITCRANQLEVAMVKGRLPLNRNGINGGFLDGALNPLGTVIIDGSVVAERVQRVPFRPCFAIMKNGKATIAFLAGTEEDANGYEFAVGGGPSLVYFDPIQGSLLYPSIGSDEGFKSDITNSVRPRTAVGITATGLVKLVTTESMGLADLALIMQEVGCINAMALDGGGSTAMVWKGSAIRGNQRSISTAILIKEMV